MKILVLNSGSSSQKTCLYEIGDSIPRHPPAPLWQGKIEWSNGPSRIEIRTAQGASVKRRADAGSRREAVRHLLDALSNGETRAVSSPSDIAVVGHRVVHGGSEFQQPTVITPVVQASLARLSVIAPLHNRAELEGIEVVEKLFAPVMQVAVFDTAFHSRMPAAAFVYPGPYDWLAQGIRRYGFHGINHEYCAERAAQLLDKDLHSLRIVSCHLGNGCSLAAVKNGQGVDTTMGFTPLEGLMMGTRSGSVDPAILTYLMRKEGLNAERLDELLNAKSGLLGISGISGDMRDILAAMKKRNERGRLAFEIFIHRLGSGIGAMIAVLGGIDALLFSAGIGENSPEVRAAACENLGYLGLKLDPEENGYDQGDCDISARDSAVRVFVIHAQEDWAIARECWRLCSAAAASRATTSS